jgi:diguanylate cyclase (GGDEF)-like protein/putative nucleotidyltransferase with HDIG domain
MSIAAKLFIAAIGFAGLAGIAVTLLGWHPEFPPRLAVYLIAAMASSRLKVELPGVNGTISLNFILIMLALTELQPCEVLLTGLAGALAQYGWNVGAKAGVRLVHLFFNTSGIALAIFAASWVYRQRWAWIVNEPHSDFLRLLLAGMTYFLVNVVPIAIVIALTERRSVPAVVRAFCDWTFCYYLVGVSLAEAAHRASAWLGWTFLLVLGPPLYLVYRSVRLYFGRMEQEKAHAEGLAALHLRTIEALATAIEAKDECTHAHLRRVQVYSLELAKLLDLPPAQMSALQAASILHDIGKLAVPDHIISKPGRLTPEEFDKMKSHSIVGAEILEQVAFPYPVAPIVRSHHEKWDGSGYPDGLKAEEIPIGARILSTVDCLDALASDRQYRRALPLEEAMDYVAGLAGRSFDPRVVDILKANYRAFERLVESTPLRNHRLSRDPIVSRGEAPDAGFEKIAASLRETGSEREAREAAHASIAIARHQIRTLVELSADRSTAQGSGEVLAMLAARLKQLVPYDCLAIYVRQTSGLKACYSSGLNSQTFASLEIPVGQGLSGWVVENGKAIINGNPAVEPGYQDAGGPLAGLHSALSIPLGEVVDEWSGVLTLYRRERDAFSADHLRLLLGIKADIARAVEGARRMENGDGGACADALTGLPDKNALIDCLEHRFVGLGQPVALLWCDIDEFRRVNEMFGRSAGDQLLRRVADILRGHSRGVDYVARVGADEFALLLADARPDELAGRVEALDRMASAAYRELCGEEGSGMAIGVACFPENGSNAAGLLAFAGQALAAAQEARRAGRNVLLQLQRSLT